MKHYAEWAKAHINSEDGEDKLSKKRDKAINSPFVRDEKEAKFFKEVADIFTDLAGSLVDKLFEKMEKK